eukprot:5925477-Prymnesium_polylepis.1
MVAGAARRCDEFEAFWEAEVPRAGQPGAPGWDKWQPGVGAEEFGREAFGEAPFMAEEMDAQV